MFLFRAAGLTADVNAKAIPARPMPAEKLPDYFTSADEVTPKHPRGIQAAARSGVDSSISKTRTSDHYKYENFKESTFMPTRRG